MKHFIKLVLQKLLGYQRYLYVFAKFKIRNLKKDKKEGDFFAFMEAVEKDGLLLDVGANIGIMTYHLAQTFPDRKVLAIEPMPSNIEVLAKVIKKYSLRNVNLISKAVGDQENQEIKMVLPKAGSVKMQGLAHVVHDSITEWNEGDELTVISDTLDYLVEGKDVAGIKMDIENYEYFALKGAEKILTRSQPVVYLELWDNENRDKCFEYLQSLNYSAHVLETGSWVNYDPTTHNKQNFLFKVD